MPDLNFEIKHSIMIKHSLTDNVISMSIANMDFSYRIPTKKIENTIDWRIGEKGTDGIVVKGVSSWALQLFTKKATEEKYLRQFKGIVQEYCPDNAINWEDTEMAVSIQNKYNWLVSSNAIADKKLSEIQIITNLKKRYMLD